MRGAQPDWNDARQWPDGGAALLHATAAVTSAGKGSDEGQSEVSAGPAAPGARVGHGGRGFRHAAERIATNEQHDAAIGWSNPDGG